MRWPQDAPYPMQEQKKKEEKRNPLPCNALVNPGKKVVSCTLTTPRRAHVSVRRGLGMVVLPSVPTLPSAPRRLVVIVFEEGPCWFNGGAAFVDRWREPLASSEVGRCR